MEQPSLPRKRIEGRRRSLFWGTSWIGAYTFLTFVVRIIRGLIIPRILAPAIYGLWTSLSVVLGYTRYADLGVQQQLAKRLPSQVDREGGNGYWNLANRGATWMTCVTISLSIGLLIYSFLYQGADAWFYQPAFRLLALVVVAQNSRAFLTTLLSTRQEFREVAFSSSLTDILALVLAVIGLLTSGVMGLIWALLISELAGTAYCLYCLWRSGMPRPAWLFRGITTMIREGLKLLAVAFLEQIMMTIDQLFLLRFFPKDKYGVYALGLFIVGALLAISGIFLTAQPRILELWGNGQREEGWQMIETNMALFVLAAALGVAFFIPVTDFMVVFYLKKYAVGLAVFMLMPVIALVRGPVILLRPYFLARNREWRLILFQVSGLILAAVLDGLIIWRGWGIAYIVMASAAGYFLTGMLMFIDFERERQSIKRAKYAMLWVGLVGVIGIYLFYQNRATQAGSLPYVAETLAVALAYLVLITGTFWIFRRSWITDVRLFMGGSKVPLFSGIIEKLIARKF